MNRKQLTLVVFLGLVLGALGLYVARRNAASYQSSGQSLGQKVLPDFGMNDVTQITMRDGTNELNLVKQDDYWQVKERHGYPADFTDIGDLLRKFWDLKAVQIEDVGPSQLPRLQLADPGQGTNSGTLIEFKGSGGTNLASVVLGKKHMRQSSGPSQFGNEGWPDGRYLRLLSAPSRVALVSDALSEVEAKADRFLSKDFFKVEKLKLLSVTSTNATNSWKLTREFENSVWTLADPKEGEVLDTNKISWANNALSYPSFVDVVAPGSQPDVTGLAQPLVARLETFDGFHYEVKVGAKTAEDNYHLTVAVTGTFPKERTAPADEKAEDKERLDKEFNEKLSKLEEKLKQEQACGKWIYLVSKWTVDPLLKERKDLFPDKKDESKPAADTASTPPAPADADSEEEEEEVP